MGLAVQADDGDDQRRESDGHDLEGGEHQVHGPSEDGTHGDYYGSHEQRHLRARAKRDVEREVALAPARHDHRGRVLGGVADQRDHDEAEKQLRQTEPRHDGLGRVHEDLALDGDERRGTAQDPDRDAGAVARRHGVTVRLGTEQLSMSDAFTRSTRPARSATIATISSAALPQVALSKPPMAGPHRAASASVAAPISAASGTTARPAAMNTASGGASSQATAQDTGMTTSSQRAHGIQNSTDSRTAVTGPSIVWSAVRRPAAADRRLEMSASTALTTWFASSRPTTFWAVRNASSLRRIVSRKTSCSSGLLRHDHTKPGPTACCW